MTGSLSGDPKTPKPSSQPVAASTSSAATDQSKPSTNVIRLGERIVDDLDLASSTDTLGRWIAHRIAELMTAAEAADVAESPKETEAISRECMDTILALWQHRSAWPQGWPPPAAKRLIELLADVYAPGGAWAANPTVLGQLQALHHDMLGTIVDVLLASPDTDLEKRWLETFGEELDPAERETLEYVTSAEARLQRLMTTNLEGAQGARALAAHLRARAETYRAIIEHVAARLEELSGTDVHQPHLDEGSP